MERNQVYNFSAGPSVLPEPVLRSLVEELIEKKVTPTCPHGRPLVVSISHTELDYFFRGCGWEPYFVEGEDPMPMHRLMAETMDRVIERIQAIQKHARETGDTTRPVWPMIVLRTPKGWTGPKVVDGKKIIIYKQPNAADIPWGKHDVDVVLECTGFYTSKEKAEAHLKGGAKKVVISAPAGNDLPTIVYNVNHKTLTKDDKIISAASCTTNCLAPMAKALNDLAPIESGIMCTIHAYTGDQMTLDGPQRKGDLRRSRAAACNIVPNSTGAAKAIGLVIPELKGKLIGAAQRVPTPTGSTTILTAVVKGSVTAEQVNEQMKKEATESFGYCEDQIVSSDIVGMRFGSLFDATQTMVLPTAGGATQVQVVSWYDNENSYTSQMVRTIKYFAELG